MGLTVRRTTWSRSKSTKYQLRSGRVHIVVMTNISLPTLPLIATPGTRPLKERLRPKKNSPWDQRVLRAKGKTRIIYGGVERDRDRGAEIEFVANVECRATVTSRSGSKRAQGVEGSKKNAPGKNECVNVGRKVESKSRFGKWSSRKGGRLPRVFPEGGRPVGGRLPLESSRSFARRWSSCEGVVSRRSFT
jgi:hypothetical protein